VEDSQRFVEAPQQAEEHARYDINNSRGMGSNISSAIVKAHFKYTQSNVGYHFNRRWQHQMVSIKLSKVNKLYIDIRL